MSFENFIEIIWSDSIFMSYENKLVFAPLCNREYEGEIKEKGNRVKINEIGSIASRQYGTANITYDELTDAAKFLDIDQEPYCAIEVEDIDAKQSSFKDMGYITREMGKSLAEQMDVYVASLHTEAGITAGLGTSDTPISITSANVVNYLSLIAQGMDENNAPEGNRVAVVPPWFKQKLLLAKIIKDTDNSEALTTGYLGTMMGFDIYVSNNVAKSGTTWSKPMFFNRNDTIAFAEQLTKIEPLRDKDRFKDLLRSLAVFGAKVTRPATLAVLTCTAGVEA